MFIAYQRSLAESVTSMQDEAAVQGGGERDVPATAGPPMDDETAADVTAVAVFEVGWATLHQHVSMAAARGVLDALDDIRTSDRDLQAELRALHRELHRQWRAGTPWRVRGRLDVLASLDLPAWAALTALFDECPVMLANVHMAGGGRPHTLDPTRFEFIATAGHVSAVHDFVRSLPEALIG